ncbi:MAG: bifunctional riboflavin kinase/FMN adenylyltransferase, partial [Lachnospiraceae bacterium]|nr:bifunctional riboflavin kinase/FMN adenylyltransferase [Lachnospiraceae bacterium]
MRIIQDTTEFHIEERSAVALGKFDGIHKGHAALLSHILEQKKNGLSAVVFTFHPSAAVYFGKGETGELTTRTEKRRFFEDLGIDVLVEFPLNEVTAAIKAEDFVRRILKDNMNAAYIAAGQDVSFGYKGLGRRELLEQMAEEADYRVEIIDKV